MIESLFGLMAALSFSGAQAAELKTPLTHVFPVASSTKQVAPPKKRHPESMGVETTSRSVFVADVASGAVLYSKRSHDVLPIASLTKLMTAMVFLDQKPNLEEIITFQEEDFDNEGARVFMVGDSMTKRDVLRALLVGSVNAAGNALARTSLGREGFIKAMNAKARSLKLRSPVFVDPTGLDPQNRAHVADVAAMLSTSLSYPLLREYASLSSVTIKTKNKEYLIKSTNLLLTSYLNKKPYSVIGAKTGSLPEAGFCMAQVTRNAAGREIVVASLASDNHFSRFQDIKALTTWAFDTYEWR